VTVNTDYKVILVWEGHVQKCTEDIHVNGHMSSDSTLNESE